MCDCPELLRDQAATLLRQADTAHEPRIRDEARGLAWAAGWLRTHQHPQQNQAS